MRPPCLITERSREQIWNTNIRSTPPLHQHDWDKPVHTASVSALQPHEILHESLTLEHGKSVFFWDCDAANNYNILQNNMYTIVL